MRAIVENLYALQQLLLQEKPLSPEQTVRVQSLRATVPAQIQGHFDRLIAQRRNGVAIVRNGVCCECHIRLPFGTAANLAQPTDIYLCENCGRYLMLAKEEIPAVLAAKQRLASPVPVAKKVARRKAVAAV